MYDHTHDDDDFEDEIDLPGQDRTRGESMPTPLVNVLCTHAHRVLSSLDKENLLIEMFKCWDDNAILSYERAVGRISEVIGEPMIDEEHVKNDGSIPKNI